MTPAKHLAEAERLLTQTYIYPAGLSSREVQDLTSQALTHAVIAVAAELGVPHAPEATGGTSAQAQSPAG